MPQALILRRLADAPGPPQDLHWLLPLVQHLIRLSPRNERRLFERLLLDHRRAETSMLDIAALFKAEGKAEGVVAAIRGLVASGVITVDQARQRIAAMQSQGELTQAQADAALALLG